MTKKEATYFKIGRIATLVALCFCTFGVGRYLYAPIHKAIRFDANHYEHRVTCHNCKTWGSIGSPNSFSIPKGIAIKDWKNSIECSCCGTILTIK